MLRERDRSRLAVARCAGTARLDRERCDPAPFSRQGSGLQGGGGRRVWQARSRSEEPQARRGLWGGRNPTTAVLPLDFVAVLRRYCAAGWIVPAGAIQHLLSQVFLTCMCLMACPCEWHCQKDRNAAAAISVGTAAPARR